MSAQLEHVFGIGYQLDANGNPIERGSGNLTDRAKRSAAAVAPAAQPAPSVATPTAVTGAAGVPLPSSVPAGSVAPEVLVVPAAAATLPPVAAATLPPATPVIPAEHPGLIAHLKALLASVESDLSNL